MLEYAATMPKPAAASQVGLTNKEAKRYPCCAPSAPWWTATGRAPASSVVHEAICKRAGVAEAANGGFYVPYEVQKRDLTVGTAANGGYLVATDLLAATSSTCCATAPWWANWAP